MADRIWICGVVAAITGMCVSAQDPLLRNDGSNFYILYSM